MSCNGLIWFGEGFKELQILKWARMSCIAYDLYGVGWSKLKTDSNKL